MTMQFWSLIGNVDYEKTSELQRRLLELRARDLIPDTILFLEHEPVITRGRGLQFTGTPRPRHMPIAPGLLPKGVVFAESERGGDLTYHGPGQLVVYPICKLDGQGFGPNHDVTGFLRKLERIFLDELRDGYGLEGATREHATGVWVGDRKIASIGIAIRRWVTYHGIAINIVNDLRPFHLISPCGFAPEVMTRLMDLVPDVEVSTWRVKLEKSLAMRFSGEAPGIRQLTLEEGLAEVDGLAPLPTELTANASETSTA